MAHADLVNLPRPVPTEVELDPTATANVRLTPNELRHLKSETGRNLSDLLGEDGDDADRLQMLAWLHLRREGFAVDWEACGDVAIVFAATTPDPIPAGSTTG